MFTSFRSTLPGLGLAAALCASPLLAQDLDVSVVRDETNNLAIYTATVTAPPGSSYWLLASPFTLAVPLTIPGFVNQLELDPAALLVVGSAPVGPAGTGTMTFALTMQPLEHIEIPFQALVVDPSPTLAFSSLATAVQGSEGTEAPASMSWVGGYDRGNQCYLLHVNRANRGDQLELKVNGGQKGTARAIADNNGFARLKLQVGLQRGDTLTLCRNGAVVRTWRFC